MNYPVDMSVKPGVTAFFDEATNTMTVLAHWKNADAYEALRAKEKFQSAMKEFGPFFAGPPEISVHEVLVDMAPNGH